MGWACDACGHAPHAPGRKNPEGRCQLRAAGTISDTGMTQGAFLCECQHHTSKEEWAQEVMGMHEAADRRNRA